MLVPSGHRDRQDLLRSLMLAAGVMSSVACQGGGAKELDASQGVDAALVDAAPTSDAAHDAASDGAMDASIDASVDASIDAAACVDRCQAGTAQCFNGYTGRTCGDANGDSCVEWLPYMDCPSGQACLDGVGCAPGFAVYFAGSGPGRLVESIGAPCTGCVRGYPPGTVVDVTAVADPAAHFVGWSGGTCTGTTPTCTVSGAATVTATFAYDCTPTVLDTQAGGAAIVLDGPHAYWTAFTDDVVKRVPRGGGSGELLATPHIPTSIAVDATHVYWSSVMLMRCAKAGGVAQPVPIPVPAPLADGGVAVDATHVYWVGGNGLFRWPLAGGPFEVVSSGAFSGSGPDGQNVALDTDYVYWVDRALGVVRRAPKAGGPVETIATGQEGAFGIVLAGNDVYWTNYDAGTVSRAPKAGGPTEVISSGQVHPTGLAAEGGHVYWITNAPNSYVSRVALGGTTVERVLFTPAGGGTSVAVDANAIYFNSNSGLSTALMRAPRVGTCAPP